MMRCKHCGIEYDLYVLKSSGTKLDDRKSDRELPDGVFSSEENGEEVFRGEDGLKCICCMFPIPGEAEIVNMPAGDMDLIQLIQLSSTPDQVIASLRGRRPVLYPVDFHKYGVWL